MHSFSQKSTEIIKMHHRDRIKNIRPLKLGILEENYKNNKTEYIYLCTLVGKNLSDFYNLSKKFL